MPRSTATAAAPVRLRLLGDPAVLGPDGTVKALERRAAGLLTLVALEPGVTRARAATLLWPDSDDARRALRQQIARFKKVYGAELIAGEDALHLAPNVEADVLTFASGDLLGRLDYDDCDEFDTWLAQQRTRRRGGEVAEISELLVEAEAQGDLAGAVKLAQQLVAVDPASEAHHRTLMRLHYLRGDIGQAQAAYDRLAAMLARDYQARPSAETEQLAQALRSARAALPVAAAPTRVLPVTVLRPPRLIGRERELAAIAAAWREGRAALLIGEPGLGKTRLLTEFAAGRNVLTVQGRPGDAGVPYATLARLLRVALERAPLELPPPRKTELARLLPELAPTVPLPADGRRLLLQGAVQDVLAQVAVQGVIVDDLHFADDASIEMLQALMANEALKDLRWALAQRPAEGTPAAVAMRAALEEAQVLQAVALTPLTESEMAALIESLGLPELNAAALAAQLVQHTGGNPLFALETLKQGLISGLLKRGQLPTPINVGALIERRLKQLSERALALARVAAVAGVDFSIALAEQVIGARAVELADAWSELEAAQVLRENAFAHDLVHEAVMRSIPAPIAKHLHAAVAEFCERHSDSPARVAEHWIGAGKDNRAGPALVAASIAALRATRPSDAAVALGRALALKGWDDQAARFDAAARQCEALFDVDLGETMARALDQLDAHAHTDAQRTIALRLRAQAALYRGENAVARDLAQQAAAGAALACDDGEYLIARSVAARGMARAGATAEAIALLRADAERARGHGENAECDHRGVLAILLQLALRVDESQVEIERAVALARKLGRWADVANLLSNRATNFHFTGRFEEALRLYEEALALAESHELKGVGTQFFAMNIASSLIELNQYVEAWHWLDRADAELRRDSPAFVPQVATLRARWYLELGQGARATRVLDAFGAEANTPDYVTCYRHQVLACIESDSGRDPTNHVLRSLDLAASGGRQFVLWEARLNAAAAGRPELAADLCELRRAAREYGFAAHEIAAATFSPAAVMSKSSTGTGPHDPTIEQLVARVALGASGRWMYRGRLLARLLATVPPGPSAASLARFAIDWLLRTQATNVPVEFRESFLHRNPVNRALLEAARRVPRAA